MAAQSDRTGPGRFVPLGAQGRPPGWRWPLAECVRLVDLDETGFEGAGLDNRAHAFLRGVDDCCGDRLLEAQVVDDDTNRSILHPLASRGQIA